MSVTEVVARKDYTGNGSVDAFAYPWRITDQAHLEVLVDGVVQTLDTDYTVSGVDAAAGGTVTFTTPPADQTVVTLLRKQPLSQLSDYVLNEAHPSDRIEKDLDKVVMALQQDRETLGRALKFGKASLHKDIDLPDLEAGKFWRTTLAGDGLEQVDAVADNGSFTQSGAGAVERTTDAKQGDWVAAEDFGAVGNDIADDLAAITAALTAHRHVRLLPNKTYRVSDTVSVPAGRTLDGSGYTSVLKAADAFGDTPVVQNATTGPATDGARDAGIVLRHFRIDGNKANNTTGTEFSHGIELKAAVDAQIDGVWIENPKGDGVLVIVGTTAGVEPQRVRVRVSVSGAARNGVAVTEGEEIQIVESFIRGSGLHGIDLECNGAASVIRNVVIRGNVLVGNGAVATDNGIVVDDAGSATAVVERITIEGNQIIGQTGDGIGFRGVTELLIRGNLIDTPTVAGIVHDPGGGTSPVNVVIDGNVIEDPGDQGIVYNDATPVTIRGNRIRSAASNGITVTASVGAVVNGNASVDGGAIGLVLSNADEAAVSGNVLRGNAGRGLLLAGGTTKAAVVGNVITGNTGVGIDETDAGTTGNRFVGNVVANNVGGNFAYLSIPETFAAADATPSVVSRAPVYATANASPGTTITDFDDGEPGQVIRVIFGDAFTTIDFTASGLKGNAGVDWTPATGDHMTCVYNGTDWYCDISDNTA